MPKTIPDILAMSGSGASGETATHRLDADDPSMYARLTAARLRLLHLARTHDVQGNAVDDIVQCGFGCNTCADE